MLFGANVTANAASLVFPDWPLMDGQLIPTLLGRSRRPRPCRWRTSRIGPWPSSSASSCSARRSRPGAPHGTADGAGPRHAERLFGIVGTAAALYVVQVVVGAFQIWTTLAAWAVSLHLALGAVIWALMAAATSDAWYDARTMGLVGAGPGPDDRRSRASMRTTPRRLGGPAARRSCAPTSR